MTNEVSGYIKLHRKLLEWGWYTDSVVKGVFLHFLLTASFRDIPWMGMTIKRGQLITSVVNLQRELGFSRQQIRTAISKLASTNEITTRATNKHMLITVVNWEEYQASEKIATTRATTPVTKPVTTKITT